MDNQHSTTDLLIKKLAGSATDAELSFLAKEMETNPAVYQEWQQLKAMYAELVAETTHPATEVEVQYHQLVKRYYRSRRYMRAGLAAAVTLLLAVALIYLLRPSRQMIPAHQISIRLADGTAVMLADSGTVKAGKATFHTSSSGASYEAAGAAAGLNTLYIPRKKTYDLSLSDGTTVKLNNATTLKFPFTFSGQRREVYVDGEAYFDVAPDPSKPFIVHSRYATIQVLGTRFNVNSYGSVRVSLAQGAVSVSTGNRDVRLTPGYRAVADSATGELAVTRYDPDTELSWMTGIIMYDNRALGDICEEAARNYDVKIVFDRKELARMPITGILEKDKPLKTFLTNIKNTGVINYRIDAVNVIHFY